MERPSPRQTFAVLAPPLAWMFHEIVGVVVTGTMCPYSHAVRAILAVTSLVALAFAIAGVWSAGKAWTEIAHETTAGESEARTRPQLVTLAAMFFGFIFTLAIFWGSLPVLLVRTVCEARE